MRETVPALSTREAMSSWSEMPGTCSASWSWSSRCRALERVEAATAATRVSSGKSARKLMYVIAAASCDHLVRSSVS